MPSLDIQVRRSVRYEEIKPKEPRRFVLFLHGYRQSGRTGLAFLQNAFAPDDWVVAPDGLFPSPYKSAAGVRLGYAWYFFDPESNVYLMDMSAAVEYLKALLAELNPGNLPMSIVGYSQGAYVAPYLGEVCSQTRQVVMVNGRYRDEDIQQVYPFYLDAVHGENDLVVDYKRSQTCHQAMLSLGNQGQFVSVPGTGHQVSEALTRALASVLNLRRR